MAIRARNPWFRLLHIVAIAIVTLNQWEIVLPIIEHYTGAIMPFGGYVGVGLLLIVTFWLYRTTVRNTTIKHQE